MIRFFYVNMVAVPNGLYNVGSNIYVLRDGYYIPIDNDDKSRGFSEINTSAKSFYEFNDVCSVILNDVVEVSHIITRSRYDFSDRIMVDFEIGHNRYQLDIRDNDITLSIIDRKCRFAYLSIDFVGYKGLRPMIDEVLSIIND